MHLPEKPAQLSAESLKTSSSHFGSLAYPVRLVTGVQQPISSGMQHNSMPSLPSNSPLQLH